MSLKLLDLFCCGGGGAEGYAAAGFSVTGVDRFQQREYPYNFVQGDALRYLEAHGGEYDFIHASPPCQGYSRRTGKPSKYVRSAGNEEPRLIEPLRLLLQKTGKLYVIENVFGARDVMISPTLLCGVMFGLHIRRHRLFETNWGLKAPPHPKCQGVALKFARKNRWHYREMSVCGKATRAGCTDRWMQLMGITHRMTQHQLAEAIPPCFTKYIAEQVIPLLTPAEVAA